MIRKLREWLQNKVFYTAWLLLHIAYQIQLEIREYLQFNLKYVKSRLLSCLPLYSHEGEISNFVESVSKLHKVPKHLAISVIPDLHETVLSTLLKKIWIFKPSEATTKKNDDSKRVSGPEEINLQALARVVAWASAANIPVISLYDYHGKPPQMSKNRCAIALVLVYSPFICLIKLLNVKICLLTGILKLRFKELGCYIQEEIQQDFWAVKKCRDATEPPVVKFHNVHKSNGYVNGECLVFSLVVLS